MASRRSSRKAIADDVLREKHDPLLEVKEDSATVQHEQKVAADVLEHYIRFRCKDEMLSTKDCLELLEITLPKLKNRRGLLQIHKATRLSFVMMLVGSGRDPPLASRAISAILVDHWCDKAPCSFLQKDAMRHSAVICAELSKARDKESVARQLEAGIKDTLAAAGVAELGLFEADCWDGARDVLFAGGAKSLQEEIEGLAQACRDATSNAKARSTLQEYIVEKRMNTFKDDFMNWGRAQLERLPGTLFDRANFSISAVPRPLQSTQNEGKSPARSSLGASAGAAAAGSSRADKRHGGGGGGSSSNGLASVRSPRRPDPTSSMAPRRISTPEKKTPPRTSNATAGSRAALSSNGDASGAGSGSDSGGSGNVSRNSVGSGPKNDTLSVGNDDGSSDSRSRGGKRNSPTRAGRGGSGSGGGGNTGGGIRNGLAGDADDAKRGQKGRGERGGAEDSSSGEDDGSDTDKRDEEEGKENDGDEDHRPSASSKRRPESDLDGAPLRQKRLKRSGGDSPRTTTDEEMAAATEALEEEAEAVAAEMVAARARPRRGAGKRNQGELFEGDQVFHVTRVFSDGDSDDSGDEPATTKKWMPGVVTSNRKDGTYDVFLSGGEVVRVVRRADLYYRRRGGGGGGGRGQRVASSLEREAVRPPGCPAVVFGSADVVAVRRGGGGGVGIGSRAGDVGEWHGGSLFVGGAAASAGSFGRRARGGGSPSSKGDRPATPAGGDGGAGAGEAKGRRRRSRVVVVIDSEGDGEAETGEESEEDGEGEDEDYVDGEDRRVSARSSGGGGGGGRAGALTRKGLPASPRLRSPASGGGGGGEGGSNGKSNRRAKGKGPARVVSTDRETRYESVHVPARRLARPRKLADALGFGGSNAASPPRTVRRGASRASSTGSSLHRAVASEEEDGTEESQYTSDSSGDDSSDEEEQQKGGARGRRYLRLQREARKIDAGRGGGGGGRGGGKIMAPAVNSGGGGKESEGGRREQGEAGDENNAPSGAEIAAHMEEAAGWGGGGVSDDSDGSSNSDSDAVASRKRQPKLRGKGKGRSFR